MPAENYMVVMPLSDHSMVGEPGNGSDRATHKSHRECITAVGVGANRGIDASTRIRYFAVVRKYHGRATSGVGPGVGEARTTIDGSDFLRG